MVKIPALSFFSNALLFVLVFTHLLIFPNHHAKAVLDSSEAYKVILDVDHYNFDTTKDTLIGVASLNREFYPKYLHWGADTASTWYDSLKVPVTELNYPDWKDIRIRGNFDDMNSDTVKDIIIVMWGKVLEDSVNYKDTAESFVLFGKKAFDTLTAVSLTNFPTFRDTPFVAAKYRIGHEYENGKKREYSYITSYTMDEILWTDTVVDKPYADIPRAMELKANMKVYPNPAIFYLDVEVDQMSPGEYELRFINMQGMEVISQAILTDEKEKISQRINTDGLPNGAYLILVTKGSKMIGKYQIIILR